MSKVNRTDGRIFQAVREPWAEYRASLQGYNRRLAWREQDPGPQQSPQPNPLRDYFESHKEGRGIWKWNHYFDIYHRHFQRFRGEEMHVLEIGVYSGGSMEMWLEYFGPKARIYGVDIEPACRAYENDRVKIFIGDQANRPFWQSVRETVPAIDIVIDDGGHQPEQ